MIILGVILLLLGLLLGIPILWTIGLIVAVVGVVLWIAGSAGHAVGGRPHYCVGVAQPPRSQTPATARREDPRVDAWGSRRESDAWLTNGARWVCWWGNGQEEGGLDTAFSHSQGEVVATPYLEQLTLKPFGPVDNGSQALYGLDYKSAMWRGDEENPFHTEVGYWLWDGATGEIVRGFVVPRG